MTRYWLKYRDNLIPLRESFVVIGRSAECDLVLNGEFVSRRHARIAVTEEGVFVEDLSANGVFLSGNRIPQRCLINGNADITVGEFTISIMLETSQPEFARNMMPTVNSQVDTLDIPADGIFGDEIDAVPPAAGEGTLKSDFMKLAESGIDQMIREGKLAEVETLLGARIRSALELGRTQGHISSEAAENATRCALKVAAVSPRPNWVNFPFELYSVSPDAMPIEIVDELYRLVHRGKSPDLGTFREYLARVDTIANRLPPTARFSLMRLRGLERLVASR